jgi:hypothetical protein
MPTERAKSALKELEKFGCPRAEFPFGHVYFDSKKLRILKADVADFARAVRKCVLLERSGELVADIDRMGKVVGWHPAQDK